MQPQKTVPAPPPDALPEPALLLRAIPGTGGAIPPAVYRRAQRQEPAQSLAETEEDAGTGGDPDASQPHAPHPETGQILFCFMTLPFRIDRPLFCLKKTKERQRKNRGRSPCEFVFLRQYENSINFLSCQENFPCVWAILW